MVTMTGELIRLDLPANPKVVSVARMAVAGAVSSARLPLGERLDDIRLAVTEACNRVVRGGLTSGADHRFEVCCRVTDSQLEIRVEATFPEGASRNAPVVGLSDGLPSDHDDQMAEQMWGRELMGALVDRYELVDDDQRCAVVLVVDLVDELSADSGRLIG